MYVCKGLLYIAQHIQLGFSCNKPMQVLISKQLIPYPALYTYVYSTCKLRLHMYVSILDKQLLYIFSDV